MPRSFSTTDVLLLLANQGGMDQVVYCKVTIFHFVIKTIKAKLKSLNLVLLI